MALSMRLNIKMSFDMSVYNFSLLYHEEVNLWEKSNLTLEEAAAYSGIGINKLRKMSDDQRCPFVLWNGTRRLIKRRKLDEYIEKAYSI